MAIWIAAVDMLVMKPVVATVGLAAVLLLVDDLVQGERGGRINGGRISPRSRGYGLALVVVFFTLAVSRFWALGMA